MKTLLRADGYRGEAHNLALAARLRRPQPTSATVAQLAAHGASIPAVAGSTPARCSILAALVALALCSGCACVVVYAPAAKTAAVQIHDQTSSNMVITESVPLSAKLADALTGISAGNNNTASAGNGNTAHILSPTVDAALKK